jgi:hypothetical protein
VHGRRFWHSGLALLTFLGALGLASDARAETPTAASATASTHSSEHAIYVELLGKGGLWGLGYDYQLNRHLGVGATASYYITDGQRVLSLSPYLLGYLLGSQRHRWFVELGPQLSYVQTPSPVPEWPGESTTGFGAELCSGYEYRHRVLVRVFGMATIGKGGFAPWMGVSLGWSL